MAKEHPRAAEVDEKARASAEASAETFRRMESGKPTPTQRELNLANVGALAVDTPKEDDGSGPEMVHVRTVVPADQADQVRAGYRTRAATPSAPAPAAAPARPAAPPPAPEKK